MKTLYNKFQEGVNKHILPVATKFGNSTLIQAISTGLMYTLPLTLVASVFSLLSSFPVASVSAWFVAVGLTPHFDALTGGTLNIISLFMAVTIPYTYVSLKKKKNTTPLMGGVISLAIFVVLMPQTVGENNIPALSFDFIGSSGMFVAMVVGIITSLVYINLTQKSMLRIKMPEGVPTNVTQSFEPLLIAFIILIAVVGIRFGLSLTPINNIFNLIDVVVAQPLLKLGSSPMALLGIAVIANSLFFFGIHPNVINTAIVPLLYTMILTSAEQFAAGQEMTYKVALITNGFTNNDAVGSTLSLLLAILIFGKSQRYKSLAKVMIVPNLFNINEPVIFGLPIMLNPILFVPFFLSTIITGLIGYFAASSGFITYYNPLMSIGIPWTVPRFISSFFSMGWQGSVLRIFTTVIMAFVYLPFVKMLDAQERKEGN